VGFRVGMTSYLKTLISGYEGEVDGSFEIASVGVERLPSHRIVKVLSGGRRFVGGWVESDSMSSPRREVVMEGSYRVASARDAGSSRHSERELPVRSRAYPLDRDGSVSSPEFDLFCEAVQSLAPSFIEQVREVLQR
jgi:hypothetical protein